MDSTLRSSRSIFTAGGLLALVTWSSTLAISTSVMAALGPLTGASLTMAVGGVASLAVAMAQGQRPWDMFRHDRRYLLGCGGMFVAYMVVFYAGVGFAPDNATKLMVGLLNHLWPALLVALSVPILHQAARQKLLLVGCGLAVAGTALAKLTTGTVAFAVWPLTAGLCAGLLWAVYSNCVRLWGPKEGGGSVPLFLLISSAIMGVLRLFAHETPHWSTRTGVELFFLAVITIGLCYVLWEAGMRRGNNRLLGLASYFVPVASTALATWFWHEPFRTGLFAGAGLVVVGAIVSSKALRTT